MATIQGLSGTGSLRIGAAFIQRYLPPGTTVYISNPTWGNHKNIFADAGVEWKEYRYYDPATVGLDFKGMVEDIKVSGVSLTRHPQRAAVRLACCGSMRPLHHQGWSYCRVLCSWHW